jgi:hypothetical protein
MVRGKSYSLLSSECVASPYSLGIFITDGEPVQATGTFCFNLQFGIGLLLSVMTFVYNSHCKNWHYRIQSINHTVLDGERGKISG